MPKVFTSDKQKIGELGESLAVMFLMKQGFRVIERNYTKKWGEIDIVATKDNRLYFIEVKSVSHETNSENFDPGAYNVSYETDNGLDGDNYRPEDNMHPWKLQRLSRTIQTYLLSKNVSEDLEWQLDLFVVKIDMNRKIGRIKIVSDIIL